MNINDICIGDSQIIEYKYENEILILLIQDYTEIVYKIVLTGCDYISVKGSVGFSLSEGKFVKNRLGEYWCFFDEDGSVMELKFKEYSMNLL